MADVHPWTMNVDPADVARRITADSGDFSRAFRGPADRRREILALVNQNGLVLIEDCAHAVESELRGKPVGTFGAFGCFSFYATKNVTTGEGGMVLTRREEDAARIKVLALHGMTKDAWKRFSDEGYKHYQVIEAGFKYNMMDLQAAIGIHQLERVETNWLRRRDIWQRYQTEFSNRPLFLPPSVEPGTKHAHHLYTILVDDQVAGIGRDAFLDGMTAQGIGVGVHYLSIPEHPYYQERFGWAPEMFPNAMRIGRQTVSLPLSPALSDEDVADVVEAVGRVLG